MADDMTTVPRTKGRAFLRRAGGEQLDYSPYRNADGSPRYPLADAHIARTMLGAGLTEKQVRHVLGYIPEAEAEGHSPAA